MQTPYCIVGRRGRNHIDGRRAGNRGRGRVGNSERVFAKRGYRCRKCGDAVGELQARRHGNAQIGASHRGHAGIVGCRHTLDIQGLHLHGDRRARRRYSASEPAKSAPIRRWSTALASAGWSAATWSLGSAAAGRTGRQNPPAGQRRRGGRRHRRSGRSAARRRAGPGRLRRGGLGRHKRRCRRACSPRAAPRHAPWQRSH